MLLRDRNFGPFIAGKIMSSCGNWVVNLAAAALMYELTASAFMVGTVSVFQFAGPLVLGLWAGSLTDRLDRRKLLLTGRLLMAGAAGAQAALVGLLGVRSFGGPPTLLACLFVIGVGVALSGPSSKALVPSLVRDEDLEQALALTSVAPSIARTIGPAMGAGLILVGGPALAFAAAAGSHLVFVLCLLAVRGRPREAALTRPRLLGGLRYLVRDRTAGLMMIGVALLGFGVDPLITLAPSLADELQGGSMSLGALVSAFGIGALLVTVSFRPIRRRLSLRRVGFAGYWILAAGWVVTALAPGLGLGAAGFFVAGTGYLMASVALSTRIQRRVPDSLRGRVMALWGLAFLGSRPLAAMANGMLADVASVQVALLAVAVVLAFSSQLARVSYKNDAGSLSPLQP